LDVEDSTEVYTSESCQADQVTEFQVGQLQF